MKTHFRKITVIAVAVAISFLTVCKKDQEHSSALTYYKVTDRMLVNNQDGRPRSANTLPVLSANETIPLRDMAMNARQIAIKNAVGENMLLTIVGNKAGELNLEQTYATTEGQASGTIYYTLVKK